jgi:hypothetical protein
MLIVPYITWQYPRQETRSILENRVERAENYNKVLLKRAESLEASVTAMSQQIYLLKEEVSR